MQKLICKLSKRFANCELQMANLNPELYQNLNDMVYSSCDIEQNILKLLILGHFLPFYPLKTQKIEILKNEKNLPNISSFYTCVTKKTKTVKKAWRYYPFIHKCVP